MPYTVECPYCEQDHELEAEDIEAENEFQVECGNEECGKTFLANPEIEISFDSREAPCLNGGAHDSGIHRHGGNVTGGYLNICSVCEKESNLTWYKDIFVKKVTELMGRDIHLLCNDKVRQTKVCGLSYSKKPNSVSFEFSGDKDKVLFCDDDLSERWGDAAALVFEENFLYYMKDLSPLSRKRFKEDYGHEIDLKTKQLMRALVMEWLEGDGYEEYKEIMSR